MKLRRCFTDTGVAKTREFLAAAKSYFLDREGQAMSLPTKFLLLQTLLEKHRALLAG